MDKRVENIPAVILSRCAALQIPLAELRAVPGAAAPVTLREAERDHIRRVLEKSNWVVGGPNGAAARLGMKRTTLQSKMKKLGISR
jgi:formate hydrogenlyase transcriptional activator